MNRPLIIAKKKVTLTEGNLKTIENKGIFLGVKTLSNTYFDTHDFRYTTSDIWLRERECRFELKVGIKNIEGDISRYEETDDELTILKKLGLDKEKELSKALPKAGIFPYATFQTIDRKYQIEEFQVHLNLAYFDDFIYRNAEIQLPVLDEEELREAEKSITTFVLQLGIDLSHPVKAKLLDYLARKNPAHYEALLASGVVE